MSIVIDAEMKLREEATTKCGKKAMAFPNEAVLVPFLEILVNKNSVDAPPGTQVVPEVDSGHRCFCHFVWFIVILLKCFYPGFFFM